MDHLSEKVREILSVELRISPHEIADDAQLRGDLGMDSVAALNIMFATEQAFGLDAIEIADIAAVTTVADVESLVRRYVAQRAS